MKKEKNVAIKIKDSSNIYIEDFQSDGHDSVIDAENTTALFARRIHGVRGTSILRWWEKPWVQILFVLGALASLIGFGLGLYLLK